VLAHQDWLIARWHAETAELLTERPLIQIKASDADIFIVELPHLTEATSAALTEPIHFAAPVLAALYLG